MIERNVYAVAIGSVMGCRIAAILRPEPVNELPTLIVLRSCPVLRRSAGDPPPPKWSAAMLRETEDQNGDEATQARRDCQVEVLVGQGTARVDAIREVRITEQTYYLYGRLSRCKV